MEERISIGMKMNNAGELDPVPIFVKTIVKI